MKILTKESRSWHRRQKEPYTLFWKMIIFRGGANDVVVYIYSKPLMDVLDGMAKFYHLLASYHGVISIWCFGYAYVPTSQQAKVDVLGPLHRN